LSSKSRLSGILSHSAALVLIVCACTGVYWGSFQVPFVFDDLYRIVNNPDIRNFDRFLSWGFFVDQRPLVDLTFALNYHFGGLDVWDYHLVNLLIHIANSLLIYILTLTILKRLGSLDARFQVHYPAALALLAALIFSVHPLQTQAVTYIAQRYTSLAAFFYLLSVLFYIWGRIRQTAVRDSTGYYRTFRTGFIFFLCFLFAVAAFLSKQNAVSIPLAILLVEFVLFDRSWSAWKHKLKWATPFATLFFIFILAGAGLFKGDIALGRLLEDLSALSRETDSAGRFQYLVTQFSVLLVYLRLLAWPSGQSLDYMYPFVEGFSWISLAGFLTLLGLITLAVYSLRRFPLVTLGIFWFLIAISVESSLIPITDALVEHRLYLGIAGFAWLFLFFLVYIIRKPVVFFPVAAVLVLGLSVTAFERNKVWQSNLSLWADVVEKHPHNHRAMFNLGNAQREKGLLEEAERQYIIALDLREDYPQAHYNLGLTYLEQDMPQQALSHFQAAVQSRPGYTQAIVNKAAVLERLGNTDEAFSALKRAYRTEPEHPVINFNLGYLYMRTGQLEKAEPYLVRAKAAGHRRVEAGFILGNIYLEQDKLEAAQEQYKEILELRPDHAGALFNLGYSHLKSGDLRQAALNYEQALAYDPEFARGHYVFAMILQVLGQMDRSVQHLIRANEIDPDFTEARQELIRVLGSD